MPHTQACGLSDQSLAKLEPETREIGQLWTRVLHGCCGKKKTRLGPASRHPHGSGCGRQDTPAEPLGTAQSMKGISWRRRELSFYSD